MHPQLNSQLAQARNADLYRSAPRLPRLFDRVWSAPARPSRPRPR